MGKRGRQVDMFTVEQIVAAIRGSGGVMTNVKKRLKCDWITAKKYVLKWPETREEWEAERETTVDRAEIELRKQIDAGEAWAVKFTLSTLGKNRGFTERTELTGANGEALDVTVRLVRPKD